MISTNAEYQLTFLVAVLAGLAAWYQVSARKWYAIYTSLVELQRPNVSVTALTPLSGERQGGQLLLS